VPPPMARAIGLEIKKCMVWKSQQVAAEQKNADAVAAEDNHLLDR